MRRPLLAQPAPLLGLVVLVGLAASATAGQRDPLYAWTDRDGIVRYTTHIERIPERRRSSAQIVEPERSAVENAALLPGARTQPEEPISTEEWLEGGLLGEEGALPAVQARPAPSETPSNLEQRIQRLEQEIQRDQTALKELISDPGAADELRTSNELARISQRLPRLQDELAALRAERERGELPDAP